MDKGESELVFPDAVNTKFKQYSPPNPNWVFWKDQFDIC